MTSSAMALTVGMNSSTPAQRWYVAHVGQQRGPLSDLDIIAEAGDGAIDAADLVWRPGFPGWRAATEIAGLLTPPPLPEAIANLRPPTPPALPQAAPLQVVSSEPAPAAPVVNPLARALADRFAAVDRDDDAPTAEVPANSVTPDLLGAADADLDTEDATQSPTPARPATEADDEPETERLRALLTFLGRRYEPNRPYFQRHWQGELPLATSFWVNGVALTGGVLAVCAFVIIATSHGAFDLPAWAITAVPAGAWLLAVATQIWGIVGIFRAAERQSGLWGSLASLAAGSSPVYTAIFTIIWARVWAIGI